MLIYLNVFCVLLAAGIVFSITGCDTTQRVIPINSSLQLTSQQIIDFANKAQAGDDVAAFRLYLYYSVIKYDRTTAIKWASMSAACGNTSAQYAMGMFYNGEIYPDLTDTNKSLYWFEKAAASGDTNALLRIQELKTK
jgi:TPR repeat protein